MPNTPTLQNRVSCVDTAALHLDPSLVVYRTRAGFTAVTRRLDRNGHPAQRFFDINTPGRDLLALVDGRRSLGEITRTYCAASDLDLSTNAAWIADYFTSVEERGVLSTGAPSSDPAMTEVGQGTLIRPAHLTVEVTDSCNLECGHCYLEASPSKRSRMTYADFERLIGAFRDQYGLSVELTGGEFFMNPDWKPILELSLREFSLVGLLTNGTVLPDDALTLLRRHSDRVTLGVSLDSVRPELHDRLRGRPRAFERTCRNVRRLVAAGLKVRLGAVIFDENMWEVRELAQFALDLGAAMFSFNYVEDFGRGHGFRSSHEVSFDQSYKEYIEGVLKDFSGLIPIIVGEQVSGSLNCGAGSGSVTVDPRGYVRPCAIFPRTRVFGNVLEDSWAGVFDSPIHQTFTSIPAPNSDHGCPLTCPQFGACYGCTLKGLKQNASRPIGERCPWVTANQLDPAVDLFRGAVTGANAAGLL